MVCGPHPAGILRKLVDHDPAAEDDAGDSRALETLLGHLLSGSAQRFPTLNRFQPIK
jgi:hypothetical protein